MKRCKWCGKIMWLPSRGEIHGRCLRLALFLYDYFPEKYEQCIRKMGWLEEGEEFHWKNGVRFLNGVRTHGKTERPDA